MTPAAHRKAVIGNPHGSFWLYSSSTGFDLTHPATPTSPTPSPHLTLTTNTLPITIAPAKCALLVIDMQNFFLSPLLGRPSSSKGLLAQQQLLTYAIPACRQAGIRIIWLNWGLTPSDIEAMPPATLRAFGFETVAAEEFESWDSVETKEAAVDSHGVNEGAEQIQQQWKEKLDAKIETSGKDPRIYRGLGSEIGKVHLDDGTVVEGGRLLMRDAWNSALTPELDKCYREGLTADPADVWIHKNRMSGLWGADTACTSFLAHEGITTLLFAGVNTDQCVGGSLQDAFTKGYDCVMLSDGCGTTSPSSSQESVEFNCAKTWGFCLSCREFADGVEQMKQG